MSLTVLGVGEGGGVGGAGTVDCGMWILHTKNFSHAEFYFFPIFKYMFIKGKVPGDGYIFLMSKKSNKFLKYVLFVLLIAVAMIFYCTVKLDAVEGLQYT